MELLSAHRMIGVKSGGTAMHRPDPMISAVFFVFLLHLYRFAANSFQEVYYGTIS